MKLLPNYFSRQRNNLWSCYTDYVLVIEYIKNCAYSPNAYELQTPLKLGWFNSSEFIEIIFNENLKRITYEENSIETRFE